MTDTPPDAQEAPADAARSDAQPEPTPDTPDAPDAPERPDREAAKYRRRLRDAETRLASVQALLDDARRAQVAQIAAETLAVPDDLWALSGASLADVLTEDGTLDVEGVRSLAEQVAANRPGCRKVTPTPDMGQAHRATPGSSGPSWSDVIRGR